MACGACGKKRSARATKAKDLKVNFMNGYQNLPPSQIKGRLELFKRKYCSSCASRYDCDINMYNTCKKRL